MRERRPFPRPTLSFAPKVSWKDRITDTIGELSQSSLDSGVESGAVDDLLLSLASVTSLEGSRLRILVNDEFSSLLLRRVIDLLREEDMLRWVAIGAWDNVTCLLF